MVIYFGYQMRHEDPELRHHNIILGPRYEELLTDIFERKILAEDFSQYLHIPTMTDRSLAPPGHHAAYTLIPVPNTQGNIDWDAVGAPFADEPLQLGQLVRVGRHHRHRVLRQGDDRLEHRHFEVPMKIRAANLGMNL